MFYQIEIGGKSLLAAYWRKGPSYQADGVSSYLAGNENVVELLLVRNEHRVHNLVTVLLYI